MTGLRQFWYRFTLSLLSNLPNVRRVGIERVFHQDDFQVGVTLVEGRAEPFGGVAFTVILLCAVLVENRFKVQWENFLMLRVGDDGGQSCMVIGGLTVAQRPRRTLLTVDCRRREMLDAVDRNNHPLLPILVLANDAGLGETLEARSEEWT